MFIYTVFVQSVGIYVSSFSMFDRRLFRRYIVGEKIRNRIIRKEKIDMELDSFPFCLFSFPLSREKKNWPYIVEILIGIYVLGTGENVE